MVQRLSVFRGGFDRDGANCAGSVRLKTLLALVNKCWIQHESGGRFQIHELLRQYGAERLAGNDAVEAVARDQHSRYYCDWLSQQEVGINDPDQPTEWDAIQRDIANVRTACMWAATGGRASRLERAANALGWFYLRGYGNYQQGRMTFRDLGQAMAADEGWPLAATVVAQRTMTRVVAWQASMCALLGDLETSRRLIGESLALLDGPTLADKDTRPERAHIAAELGYTRLYTNPETARQRFTESLERYRGIGHKWGMAYALLGLGRAARNLGVLREAREAMTQSLSLHREIGNRIGESEAMAALRGVAIRQLQFQEAEDLIRQSLSLTPESNRFGIAYGLGFLGDVQLLTGRFAEVEATLSECIAIYEDLGWRVWAVRRSVVLARARLHAGAYDAARIQGKGTVALAQEVGWGRGIRYGKLVLGMAALVQGDFAEAHRTLQDVLLDPREFVDDPGHVDGSAWLGLAARGLDRRVEAWQHLTSALDSACKRQQFNELMAALAGIALLLADEGETKRAIELYALASRYPFVANSHWFEDVVGQHIGAVGATLPPQIAAAAQERGRSRELEATVGELSAELGRSVPGAPC